MLTAKMVFSANLKRLRKSCGFTQVYMSNRLDVALSTYQRWEMAETWPGSEEVDKLMRVLRCAMDDLFCVTKPRGNNVPSKPQRGQSAKKLDVGEPPPPAA